MNIKAKEDKKIRNNILFFLNEYYQNNYACILSGSYVDGKYNEYSDIDVLIFTKDRAVVFNETLSYKNLKIQAIIIPVQNIQELLWVDYITCKGAFINMISKGKIIFDTANFLSDLQSHAAELQNQGGRLLSSHEIYMMRVKITSLLMDIKGGHDLNELTFSIASALDLLTELKLKFAGSWCGDGKYRARHIQALDPLFYNEMNNAMYEIYANKDKTPLVKVIEKELNVHGGLISYYSKANTLSSVAHNYIVIEINTENKLDILKIKNTVKILSEFIQSITTHHLKYYFFSSNAVETNKREPNIYMVIDADMHFINDYLIDRLNFLVHNKPGISRVLFPFQFDTRFKFSSDDLYSFIAPLFYKTSWFTIENNHNVLSPSFQLDFSIQLMKQIKLLWFANDNQQFVSFLDYLLESWLVLSYDDGTVSTTLKLLHNKNIVLDKFNSMFLDQKTVLCKTYKSKCSFDKDFLVLLKSIPQAPGIETIPAFKTYLLEKNTLEYKKISLFKEVLFRVLSVNLIDSRFAAYVPFVIKKIVLK
ncbi:nucleotidyltransferase domain-containing protein [Flavobacterium geliluteum]|uniref:Nucleotidyltransferase domain-containing protein n=1 Tax=Flavobacterium geliluteum TaxID=2816120 RepID=A0A940XC92_9FLAO|nr:nucleotidyltransferase domain-containing protein [Flavobacterium geliluteum]MBP4140002.1 nucleotidyltransferase domain-containing protein [Flavobacterium geliluteum]